MSKIGIFGGTFDPIHNAHIALAEKAASELKLAETLVIPAAEPPLKSGSTAPFADRFEMTRLAFEGKEKFAVSDIEKKLGGKSYTINTIRALKEIYPKGTEFYLLIGGDALFSLEKWFRFEAILKECHVVAVTRAGSQYADMVEYANEIGRVKVLDLDIPDISSRSVREMIAKGEDITGLVPGAVSAYISGRGLYRG